MTPRRNRPSSQGLEDLGPATSRLSTSSIAIIAGLLGLAVVLFFPLFSGTGQWTLGLLLLVIVAVIVFYEVSRRTKRPEPFGQASGRSEAVAGELASLRDLVGRANRGLAFSQDLLVSRLRNAVLERIRLRTGSPVESGAAPEVDDAAIRDRAGEPAVREFLRSTEDREARATWVEGAGKDPGLAAAILRVLDELEA